MWKWNGTRGYLSRWGIYSPHHALFRSPGSLGESLIFSPSSWVPAAVHFVAVILWRPEEQLFGSVPAPMRKKVREGGSEERSLVSRTLSHSVCIEGNNRVRAAGLQQGGVIMICHPVVQFAVQSTQTHPNSPPAPLNLHPGYISLTQLCEVTQQSRGNLIRFPGNVRSDSMQQKSHCRCLA